MNSNLDQPYDTPWFWELLETSNRRLVDLCRKLELLPKERLIQYRLEYDDAKDFVNPCLCNEYYEFVDYCSEDHGDDFAAWVVMQGREFFDELRLNPKKVTYLLEIFETPEAERLGLNWDESVDQEEYWGNQRADSIASPIFRVRFNEDLFDTCYDDQGLPRFDFHQPTDKNDS